MAFFNRNSFKIGLLSSPSVRSACFRWNIQRSVAKVNLPNLRHLDRVGVRGPAWLSSAWRWVSSSSLAWRSSAPCGVWCRTTEGSPHQSNTFTGQDRHKAQLLFMLCQMSWMWPSFVPFRTDDLKEGTLIGEDKYGNKYYENNKYFYGKTDDDNTETVGAFWH